MFIRMRHSHAGLAVLLVWLLSVVGFAESVKLSFATPLASWPEMQAATAKFEEENPDISVELFAIPDVDSGESIIRFALSGQMPDLFTVHHVSFRTLLKEGILQDLDVFFAKDAEAELQDYVGHYMGVPTTYVLPFTVNVWFAMYNHSMFEGSGLEAPDVDLWDLDDFQKDVFKLTRLFPHGSPLDEWGYGGWGFNLNMVETWFWPFGAAIFDESGHPTVDTPQMTEALEYWTSFVDGGLNLLHNETLTEWPSGRVGVCFADRAAISKFLNQDISFDWGLVNLPIKSGVSRKTVGTGHYFGISSSTAHPEAAWKLLKWITGPEGHDVFRSKGLLPGHIGAFPIYEEFWADRVSHWNVPRNLDVITYATQFASPPSFMYTALPQAKVQPVVADYLWDIILYRSIAPEVGISEMQRLLEATE